MRCDNDSGRRHVRHGHGNVNKAETVDTVNSKGAREMTGIVMLYYSVSSWYASIALRCASQQTQRLCVSLSGVVSDPCGVSSPS